ncbi:hypothetical protein ES705_20473 [subsurface metagenome]
MRALVLLFFIIPVVSLGQIISADFENGDLTDWYQSSSDHWAISADNPVEGQYSLKHHFNNDEASTDWIALFHEPLQLKEGNTSWQFSIRYDFNPSSANHWAIFLSDNSLPDNTIEYALVFGVNYNGNSDELQLWEISNGVTNCILNTGFNWEDNIKRGEVVGFKLSLSKSGVFAIKIDTSGGIYHSIGQQEIEHKENINVFTLYYKYTSTYDGGLTFDDFTATGELSNEHSTPGIESIHVIHSKAIELKFTEVVRLRDDQEFCVEGVGCSIPDLTAGSIFLLELPGILLSGSRYNIHLPEVEDMYGNRLSSTESTQQFYYPEAYDIVINEILADPSPPVLMPETEFVEILNTSAEDISVKGWLIAANDKVIVLSNAIIPAGGYAILCDKGSGHSFDTIFHTITCNNFPVLNNSGAEVKLLDCSGRLIHAIQYSDAWFRTPGKRKGGWSLEMLDPFDPCSNTGNWMESIAYRGGTPGKENSVFQPESDYSPPELWRAAITKSGSVMLYFSEPLDSLRSISTKYYMVDQRIGKPDSIRPAWPILDRMELFFNTPFKKMQQYEILITADVCDCSGFVIKNSENHQFSLPAKADSGDIAINEIMFDPGHGFIEYLELYNHSDKTIDVGNYCIIVGELTSDKLQVTNEYFPIPSDSYAIIANDYSGIDNSEVFSAADRIIHMQGMPYLPNSGSVIYLFNEDGKICDAASYSPKYHHDFLTDTKGVALERISADRSGLNPGNWHSASSNTGYQTPAASNSQSELQRSGRELTISPETITPNGDGTDDELIIYYRMDNPGYLTRIMVFDANGRKRYTLANGDILGTEGYYNFNGKDARGNILPTGYYVLFFDAYSTNDSRYTVKKSFVVAGGR